MSPATGWKGYNFTRAIGGQVIPHSVQNLVIRTYARKKELLFLFSITEYYMDGCYMMLDAELEQLDGLAGLIFYSTHLLPKSRSHREKIYRILLAHGCGLHFALEELAITGTGDIAPIEDIFNCRALALDDAEMASRLA